MRNSLREGANPLRHGLRRATSPKGTPFGTADLHAKHTLKVELEGAGILEAAGSANPCSEERYDTPESETFDGGCMAVIRAGEAAGEIHLTVTADDSVQKQLTILISEAADDPDSGSRVLKLKKPVKAQNKNRVRPANAP